MNSGFYIKDITGFVIGALSILIVMALMLKFIINLTNKQKKKEAGK